MQVTLPNGENQVYSYAGRISKVTGKGLNGDPDKLLKYTKVDGLGYLKYVRSAEPNGTNQNRVKLEHNAMGNLLCVWHEGVNSSNGCTGSGVAKMSYDMAGRKLSMDDPHLGVWCYVYDRLGNLTEQTDANGNVTTLTYDGKTNRLTQKSISGSSGSSAAVTYQYDSSHSSNTLSCGDSCRGQLTYIAYTDGRYAKHLNYNDRGLLSRERVTIQGAPSSYDTTYNYDTYHRQHQTIYPDGDVVTTEEYNSMGLPISLRSSKMGLLVDGAWYQETGALSYYRMPRGTDRYYRAYIYGWGDGNRRLSEIRVGTSSNTSSSSSRNRVHLTYSYNSFGNIKTMGEQYQSESSKTTHTFSYDGQNRLTAAFGKNYSYAADGEFTNFEGKSFTSSPSTSLRSSTAVAVSSSTVFTSRF